MENLLCSICRGESDAEWAVLTVCGHMFHEHCIASWLKMKHRKHEPKTCPECRSNTTEIIRKDPNTGTQTFYPYVRAYIPLFTKETCETSTLDHDSHNIFNGRLSESYWKSKYEKLEKFVRETYGEAILDAYTHELSDESLGRNTSHEDVISTEPNNKQSGNEQHSAAIQVPKKRTHQRESSRHGVSERYKKLTTYNETTKSRTQSFLDLVNSLTESRELINPQKHASRQVESLEPKIRHFGDFCAPPEIPIFHQNGEHQQQPLNEMPNQKESIEENSSPIAIYSPEFSPPILELDQKTIEEPAFLDLTASEAISSPNHED